MKSILWISIILLSSPGLIAQNVGINETNPGAKLTIKPDSFEPSLLIKSQYNDSAVMVNNNYIGMGDASFLGLRPSVLTIANKYARHFDSPQLNIMATGMRSGGYVNGASSRLIFTNSNYPNEIELSALNETGSQHFSISRYNRSTYEEYPLLFFAPNGMAAMGGNYFPVAKLQINHRASSSNPTLLLHDSSTTEMPTLRFRNAGFLSKHWAISGEILSTDAASHLNIGMQSGTKLTVTGAGNVGIGNTAPSEKLEVAGNVKLTGELIRPATGTANLAAICYGNVSSTGAIYTSASTDNFSVTRVSTGKYNINISGETYAISTHHATASPITTNAIIAVVNGGGGILYVDTFNLSGVAVDCAFSFTVFKK